MGPLNNMNFLRIFAIFQPTDCSAMLMTYPGQAYEWTQTATCQNLAVEFGSLWTETTSLQPNQYYTEAY